MIAENEVWCAVILALVALCFTAWLGVREYRKKDDPVRVVDWTDGRFIEATKKDWGLK